MRCGRAQQMMTAAVDGELAARGRRELDVHLAGCESCRSELAATERLSSVLAAFPREAAVSTALEQTTLRRVRLEAAAEEERAAQRWWRSWLQVPAVALATAAMAILAFGILRYSTGVSGPTAVSRPTGNQGERVARAPAAPRAHTAPAAPKAVEPPSEPPSELTAAPDKFMDLHILRNLEKLEHFDAIRMTTLDDEPATPGGEAEPSNG